MKRAFMIIVCLLTCFAVRSQNNDITIGLIMPEEEMDGIKVDAFKLLQSKLERMLTSCGVSASGGEFVMYPTISILDGNIIEGGIKNYYKVKLELTMTVANLSSRTTFSNYSCNLNGTAERDKSLAVKNAFAQITTNDPRFKSFIEDTKTKIQNYYETNKDTIMAKAETLASTGKYDEALAFLSSYPSQAKGYAEVQAMIEKIYIRYIDANAGRLLSEANAALASKDYDQCVSLASQIVPESSYYKEAKKLMDEVRASVEKDKSEENERAMKALEIAADVEKCRVNAVASVASAYYSRRAVNYTFIKTY